MRGKNFLFQFPLRNAFLKSPKGVREKRENPKKDFSTKSISEVEERKEDLFGETLKHLETLPGFVNVALNPFEFINHIDPNPILFGVHYSLNPLEELFQFCPRYRGYVEDAELIAVAVRSQQLGELVPPEIASYIVSHYHPHFSNPNE